MVEKPEDTSMALELPIYFTPQPQPMKIGDLLELEQCPDVAPNEGISPTMDWSDENTSCGEFSVDRPKRRRVW